jgi:hypothetical protein
MSALRDDDALSGPAAGWGMRSYSVALGALAILFLGRVAGQMAVACFGTPFLPAMERWSSGVLPYPVLLPIQLAILGLQFEISRELWIGRGPFTVIRARIGSGLKWFSMLYCSSMLARYVITMALFPDRRWLGGLIPIVFHLVLAAYLYLLSRYHRGCSLPLR